MSGSDTIRAIAIDLDGTLLNNSSLISSKNRDAIQRCIKKGIRIIISSAKTMGYIRTLMADLSLKDPQICSGGAIIIDSGPKPLYEFKIHPAYAREIIQHARDFQEGITLACNDGLLYYESWHENLEYITKSGEKLMLTDDLSKKEIVENALMFSITVEKGNRLEAFLIEKFKDMLQITRGGEFFLTILHQKASKANALRKIISFLGFDKKELLAIGDSQNDIETLKWAGTGVAMGNAIEELKQIADFVVEDNDHDGVASAIENMILS